MDIKNDIVEEVEAILDNLPGLLSDKDESSKEYTTAVNNATRLNNILLSQKEIDEKASQNKITNDLKERQFQEDIKQKSIENDLAREKFKLEETKAKNQHEERMKEIENENIKLSNENMMLKLNLDEKKREFKSKRRSDIIGMITKILVGGGVIAANVGLALWEIHLERVDNGLVPKRVNTYQGNINKGIDVFTK